MNVRLFVVFAIPLLLLGGAVGGCTHGETDAVAETVDASEHAELALHMSRLQRWTHKTTLAMDAQNATLAGFYLHEMEESIETIQDEAPTYEGHAVAELTEKMLVPSVETLEGALDNRDWTAVDGALSDLERACNQCHTATKHGFVKVDLEDVPNPYAQDFSPDNP